MATTKEYKDFILEQLKLIAILVNKMCEELEIKKDIIITQNLVEAVIVYVSSIQNSLCDFANKFTKILEEKIIEQ